MRADQQIERVLSQTSTEDFLEQLDETEVFTRCLQANNVPTEQYQELQAAYQEILQNLHEIDNRAE